ncbi:MAG TPA: methyltransferase domain-containing protein [Reyranella sp.]|nr:methyltransferase domain-containing protein [Reyranella sp.]
MDWRSPVGTPSLSLDDNELARDYDRISSTRQFEAGKRLIEDIKLRMGERVLDVGCGTGLLAEYIADIVGPSGYVLGIDPLPLRIELAAAKARANLAFKVGDAYDLEGLPDASFDVIVLNAVFHWLPQKTGPLLAFARLLRPGGRIGISTALKGHRTRLQEIVASVLAEPQFARYPRPRESLTFRVDGEELRALFETTGFAATQIEMRENEQRFPSAEAAIRFSEASSFGNFLGHLPDDLKFRARSIIRQRLTAITTADGILQHGRRLVAVAVRK